MGASVQKEGTDSQSGTETPSLSNNNQGLLVCFFSLLHERRLCDLSNLLTFTRDCIPFPPLLTPPPLQGWVILYSEVLEKDWKEKHEDWVQRSRCE